MADKPIKPMLAASEDTIEETLAQVRYPLLASPKLDGIRGFVVGGTVTSRNLKALPNKALQARYGAAAYEGHDGEFVVGDPTAKDCFRKSQSVTSSHDKPIDDLLYYVFDCVFEPQRCHAERTAHLEEDEFVRIVEQKLITNEDDLLAYEQRVVDELGYEGLILRNPKGRYKYGRSTMKEGFLIKLKRFVDDEAVIIGFEEKMHNGNEKTLVKNGRPARNSNLAGLVPLGTLGAIRVRWNNVEFNIGSGFTAEEADAVWRNRDYYLGKLAKFKYFPVGMKDLPRHPVFLGFRDKDQ